MQSEGFAKISCIKAVESVELNVAVYAAPARIPRNLGDRLP